MTTLMFRLLFSFAVALAMLPAKTNAAEEPIRIQMSGEPSTLDPARVIDQYGFGILRNVVTGLYKFDRDGKLADGLMQSHKISKNGLVYRFKIRRDARWSDGKPVTIEDFITGFRYGLDPKTASPNAGFFFAIKNAPEVFQGKKPVEALAVRKEGDELVIELEKPDPSFLHELAFPTAGPLRKDFLDANGGQWKYNAPVTGDYMITVYKPAELIELTPNPHNKKPGQRTVLYRILPEEITAMNLFESGRLDVITTITPTEIERLRKQGLVQTVPSTTVFYVSFNMSKPPFNDIAWRRAISSSVDREGLVKLLNGVYLPMTSYIPQPLEGSLPYVPMDDKEAIQKIKAIEKKPKVRLAFGTSALTKIVSEKIQNDFERKLGLRITIEPSDLKTLLGKLKADPPEMYFLGMSALFDDPMNQLKAFSNDSEPTYSRYANPEYEKLVELVRVTPKGAKRTDAAKNANRILIEKDVALVPIVLRNQVFGVSKNLKGFHASPYQVIQLNELRK